MPSEVKWGISFIIGLAVIVLGWKVPLILTTVHILICFLLIIVVLMQSGKAADLAGAFGGSGSQTAFGPRGAATLLSKATTWCAVMFMLTSLTLTLRQNVKGPAAGSSVFPNATESAPEQAPPTLPPAGQQPATPTPQPPAQQPPAQQPSSQPPGQ